MKKLLIILLLISCFLSQGQQNKISFSYDSAGNQITRSYCYSCAAKNSNNLKDVSQINDSDLLKFIPDDNFSYYPNPVKEELFLTWNKQDEIILNSIKLYNLNGSLLKSFVIENESNSQNIIFQEYPVGVYILELVYSNGEEKTIKIIK